MAAVMMAYPVRDSFQDYPQQYAMYQSRAHQPQVDVAQSLNVNPYANFNPAPESQQYIQPQAKPQQPAASIITEDGFRPSLPSISNLLGIADGERGSQEAAQQAQAQAQAQVQAQAQAQAPTPTQQQPTYQHVPPPPEHRHPAVYQHQEMSSSQRTAVPPTPPPPPMRSDSVVESTHSPSTISTGSSLSMPQQYFVGSSLNNVEATDQRAVAAQFAKRHSLPSQPHTSPYGAYTSSPYTHSPGTMSNGSYYSPTEPSYQQATSGLYHQRPLPSNFPPQPAMPVQQVQGMPAQPNRNIWEHHHYINQNSQSIFPQSQDRYVCSTCNKAFSRPSSLKIHSNSHTGEKPYKCPHTGCGKAFSVRSNMKRHQRGCHTEGGGLLGASHLR